MQASTTRTKRVVARVEVERCGVCSSPDRTPYYAEGDIVECLSCRVLYVSPRPTDGAITDFYSAPGHYDHWDEEPGRGPMWQRRVDRLRKLVPSGKLLDIGGGQGDFGSVARKFYDFDGTEISSEGVRVAKETHGLNMRLGDVLDLDIPKESFDIITLWHVLEHVVSPLEMIERCNELLKPGGVVCVAVPNTDYKLRLSQALVANTVSVAMKAEPKAVLPIARLELDGPTEEIHLTHFTLRTLSQLMRRLGMSVIETGLDDFSAGTGWKPRYEHARDAMFYRVSGLAVGGAIFVAARKPG